MGWVDLVAQGRVSCELDVVGMKLKFAAMQAATKEAVPLLLLNLVIGGEKKRGVEVMSHGMAMCDGMARSSGQSES